MVGLAVTLGGESPGSAPSAAARGEPSLEFAEVISKRYFAKVLQWRLGCTPTGPSNDKTLLIKLIHSRQFGPLSGFFGIKTP